MNLLLFFSEFAISLAIDTIVSSSLIVSASSFYFLAAIRVSQNVDNIVSWLSWMPNFAKARTDGCARFGDKETQIGAF